MKQNKTEGIILLIDFEKAFDTLEWSFLDKALKYLNFGEKIRKWIQIFYTDIESCIINNRHCSNRFKITRGVRQGDPLSPYLFIIAAQILTSAICRNRDIKGINIDDTEYIINQLADDTTLFLENDEKSFKECMHLLERFSSISGLKVNYSKTTGIKININEKKNFTIDGVKDITWH